MRWPDEASRYDWYTDLRATLPVCRISSGPLLVTRRSDVLALLHDARLSSQSMPRRLTSLTRLTNLDPPVHTSLRGALAKAIARSMPLVVEATGTAVTNLATRLAATTGTVDLVPLLEAVPSAGLAAMLGLRDQEELTVLGRRLGSILHAVSATSLLKAVRITQEAISEATTLLKNDWSSIQVGTIPHTLKENGVDTDAMTGLCIELLFAGQATTSALMGSAALRAFTSRRRRCSQSIEVELEETLRLESPVQYVPRVSTCHMTICGQPVRPGERLLLSLGSANRDLSHDPARRSTRSLSFGIGVHSCPGSRVARLQANAVLAAVRSAAPTLRFLGAEWDQTPAARRLRHLYVERLPGAGSVFQPDVALSV
jgi:cytochrome P450